VRALGIALPPRASPTDSRRPYVREGALSARWKTVSGYAQEQTTVVHPRSDLPQAPMRQRASWCFATLMTRTSTRV